jgi:hypothetical protein
VKGSSAAHTPLCRAILAELGALSGVIIGLNASGRAKYVSERTGREFVVPYGCLAPGGPDLIAVVAPLGRTVALEVKSGRATETKEQLTCLDALRAVGVRCVVVRSVAEARAALEAN